MFEESAEFLAAWRAAEPIPGWLTEAQAALLHHAAQDVPDGGTALEIGSHQGRSTVILAATLGPREVTVIAVDPFVEGRLFGGATTRDKFERHLTDAGVREHVELITEYSTKLRPGWERPLDFLYIDGKHDYWTLSDDLRWSEQLTPWAPVLVHDSFSSIGVTLGLLRHVLFSQELAYESRAGSMALFRVRPPRPVDRLRMLGELPWWIRNVFIKVLLRLRLRPVARLFGHDSPYDPY